MCLSECVSSHPQAVTLKKVDGRLGEKLWDVVVFQPLKRDGLKSWQTDKETDGIGSHVYLNTLIVGDGARLLL